MVIVLMVPDMAGFLIPLHKKGEIFMRATRQNSVQGAWLVILAGCLMFLIPSFVVAGVDDSGMSVADTLFIQGSVRKVVPDTDTVTVKNIEGKRVKVVVSPQTEFIGLSSFTELAKERKVKIWYSLVGDTNSAVKVELLPDLGC